MHAFESRRGFLRKVALSSAGLAVTGIIRAAELRPATSVPEADAGLIRTMAVRVLDGARIPPGGRIPDGPKNTTGHALRVPGATLSYYPAFWVRDAAMMLGGDFVPASEVEGWVRVIAAVQPGAEGLRFGRLIVPPYSIPDHITLDGRACWYPGAYVEQGNGNYGFLPPADDAFYFLQMVHEHWRLTRTLTLFQSTLPTAWGQARLSEICLRAFGSVAVDDKTGLVICEATEGRTRVDWGFCDSIRKTGLCLMPSLLRWRAARELAALLKSDGNRAEAKRVRAEADKIQSSIPATFYRDAAAPGGAKSGLLLSATELGRKDDVWASAFAVWLGILPRQIEMRVARHLLALYEAGGTVAEGQVRHLPPTDEFGGHWEKASSPPGEYQNGGFWATPTGWMIYALRRVNRGAGDRLLAEYATHLRAHRDVGAPWEWIQPTRQQRVNPLYGSSAGLVSIALESRG